MAAARTTETHVRSHHGVLVQDASKRCNHKGMASTRTTFTLDGELAERARQLGVNISAAARQGVADAVRAALARSDRAAYQRQPEREDTSWTKAEAWGEP